MRFVRRNGALWRPRTLGTIGIGALVVADAALIGLALRPAGPSASASALTTTSGPAATPTSPAAATSPAPSPSPSASPSADGTVTPGRLLLAVAGDATVIAGTSPERCGTDPVTLQRSDDTGATWAPLDTPAHALLAVHASSADDATLVGLDADCAPTVWTTADGGDTWTPAATTGLPGPLALAGVSTGSLWAYGEHLAAGTTSALTSVKDPCAPGFPTTALVAGAAKGHGVVVCAKPASDGAQARLVYHTTDGGTSWSAPAGALHTGPGGRKDGLDDDGALVAVGSTGGDGVAAALAGVPACAGLQVRTAPDGGYTWTTKGCLLVDGATADTRAVLGGDGTTLWALVDRSGGVAAFHSADGGPTWASVTLG